MAQKVESFASQDGRLFPTEREADMADIETALRSAGKPHLLSSVSVILREAEFLAHVLSPLVDKVKNHPADLGKTTREVVETTLGERVCNCDKRSGLRRLGHESFCPRYGLDG